MCASVGEKIVGLIRGKIDLLKKVGNRTQEENTRNQAQAEEDTEKGTVGRNERKQGIMTMWGQAGPCPVTPCFAKQQFFQCFLFEETPFEDGG